jgi:K(+)-stimulated pyrophosphate-energized sodium pump
MNLVSVLIAPAIVALTIGDGASTPIRYGIAAVAFVIVAAAVAYSKSKDLAIGGDNDPDAAPAMEPHPAQV